MIEIEAIDARRNQCQPLTDIVVKIPGNLLPLVFVGGHEPARERSQLNVLRLQFAPAPRQFLLRLSTLIDQQRQRRQRQREHRQEQLNREQVDGVAVGDKGTVALIWHPPMRRGP